MTEANKRLLRQFIEAGDAGRLDQFDELISADAIDRNPFPGQAAGVEGVKQIFQMLRNGFPDLSSPVVALVAEGDKVCAVQRLIGTHSGNFLGAPATGRTFEVVAINWVRASGGKFVEHWGLLDQSDLMSQLGLAPQAGPARQPRHDAAIPGGAIGSPEDNKALWKNALEATNAGDLDELLSYIHEDAVDHTALPGQAPGREGFRYRMQMLLGAFSDVVLALEDQISEGDLLSNRYRFSGRHTGELNGAPATGKTFETSAIDAIRIRDHKTVEHWGLVDMPDVMVQLGLAPAPG